MAKGVAKLKWFEQLRDDPEITPAAFVVGFEIAGHINHATGTAWPSHATLAREARMSERQVRNLIDLLVNRGHLTRKSGGGRRISNRYALTFKTRKYTAGNAAGDDARNTETDCHVSDQKPGNFEQETRQYEAENPATHCRGTPGYNPGYNPGVGGKGHPRSRAADAALAQDFIDLVSAYPANDGDLSFAAAEFGKAIEEGHNLSDIFAGARAYAERCTGNAQYLGKWLQERGWLKKQPQKRNRRRKSNDPFEEAKDLL